jgi:hypothetical protein
MTRFTHSDWLNESADWSRNSPLLCSRYIVEFMNIYKPKCSLVKVFGLHILHSYVNIHNVNSNTDTERSVSNLKVRMQ